MQTVALPRQSLLLLVLAVISSLVPHLGYLPVWFYGMALFVLGWRALVYWGYVSFPGRVAKTIAVGLACAGVYSLSGGQISLEASSAFLISAGVLKLLEMANRRDGVVVVFIAFFIQATGFLFQQNIFYSIQGIGTLVLATAAMISTQAAVRTGIHTELPVFRMTARLLFLALPFMLIVYFLFPRFGPLWSVALQSDSAMTGLSERMQPGDISDLSQSSAVAFRVTFDGKKPDRSELYWRAMTLDRHDGEGWDTSRLDQSELPMSLPGQPLQYRYEVIQEPTGQHFLFSLAGPYSTESQVSLTSTRLLRYDRPVYQRIQYQAESAGGTSVGPAFDPRMMTPSDNYLRLPADVNPQTKAWARELSNGKIPTAAAFAQAFKQYISREPFFYTLRPPRYSGDDIDQFLFAGRRGFCEHYASAMTFAARAAGIPARVVAGYQGGEWHPDGYLTVRQYDAHAWVELWDGSVWVRTDPTAAVAPERIEYGLREALAEENSFLADNLLSPHRYQDINWINSLRLQMDNINYLWSRWVLSYDGDRQKGLLSRWFGIDQLLDGLYVLAASIAGLFIIGATWQWWQQRPDKVSRIVQRWQRLTEVATRAGVPFDAGVAPLSLLKRISERYPPLAEDSKACAELFVRYQYAGEGDTVGLEKRLSRLIRRLRRIRPGTEAATSRDVKEGAV